MAVANFPPPSLQAQLDELRRERLMRGKVYPHMIASRKIDPDKADHNNRGLDGAIATLERLVEAQRRGEPGRKELIEGLREALLHLPSDETPVGALRQRIADMLERVAG